MAAAALAQPPQAGPLEVFLAKLPPDVQQVVRQQPGLPGPGADEQQVLQFFRSLPPEVESVLRPHAQQFIDSDPAMGAQAGQDAANAGDPDMDNFVNAATDVHKKAGNEGLQKFLAMAQQIQAQQGGQPQSPQGQPSLQDLMMMVQGGGMGAQPPPVYQPQTSGMGGLSEAARRIAPAYANMRSSDPASQTMISGLGATFAALGSGADQSREQYALEQARFQQKQKAQQAFIQQVAQLAQAQKMLTPAQVDPRKSQLLDYRIQREQAAADRGYAPPVSPAEERQRIIADRPADLPPNVQQNFQEIGVLSSQLGELENAVQEMDQYVKANNGAVLEKGIQRYAPSFIAEAARDVDSPISKVQRLVQAVQGMYGKDLLGGGPISDFERKLIDQIVGSPTSFAEGELLNKVQTLAALNQQREQVMRGMYAGQTKPLVQREGEGPKYNVPPAIDAGQPPPIAAPKQFRTKDGRVLTLP